MQGSPSNDGALSQQEWDGEGSPVSSNSNDLLMHIICQTPGYTLGIPWILPRVPVRRVPCQIEQSQEISEELAKQQTKTRCLVGTPLPGL